MGATEATLPTCRFDRQDEKILCRLESKNETIHEKLLPDQVLPISLW